MMGRYWGIVLHHIYDSDMVTVPGVIMWSTDRN
jgi:hypothetical protein